MIPHLSPLLPHKCQHPPNTPATPWQTLWTCGGVLSKCSLQSTSWCLSVCVLMHCVECTVPSPASLPLSGKGVGLVNSGCNSVCTALSPPPPQSLQTARLPANRKQKQQTSQKAGTHWHQASLGKNTKACISENASSHGLAGSCLDSESSDRRFESWLNKASDSDSGSRQVSSRP